MGPYEPYQSGYTPVTSFMIESCVMAWSFQSDPIVRVGIANGSDTVDPGIYVPVPDLVLRGGRVAGRRTKAVRVIEDLDVVSIAAQAARRRQAAPDQPVCRGHDKDIARPVAVPHLVGRAARPEAVGVVDDAGVVGVAAGRRVDDAQVNPGRVVRQGCRPTA